MKKISSLLALAGLFVSSAVHADLFDNIQLWVGTGANEAAVEIDWNNGTANDALIWGYRWNGTATGEQMLDAIVTADPRLYAEISEPTDYGTAVFGLGFHQSGDQNFQLSPALSFNSQHLAYTDYGGVNDSRTAVAAGDLWQEGWYNAGYWSYWLSTDVRVSANQSDWDFSDVGISSRVLDNGDVDGWSFAYNFNATPPATPLDVVPAPEPATWALLVLSGLLFVCLKRNRHFNKITGVASLAVVASLAGGKANAISLDDIQLWTGSGTNRAALVIEWSVPESLTNSTVPVPVADKTLVWGYRFNGAATGTQMLDAILAADPKLYVVADETYGTFIEAIGYNLKGDGVIGITDGTSANFFTNGILTSATVDVDDAHAINSGDLYWGGLYGPNWETWNELGDAGGFLTSPNRGPNQYWTAYDINAPYAGVHGQWELAQNGLDGLQLTNGSWIGFSVAAGEYEASTNAAYNLHKHAPPSPDGTYTAYVCNTNDFAVQVISTNGMDPRPQYNQPYAVLGRPTLRFYDALGEENVHRVKIVEPPYWTDPNGSNVIFVIPSGGQVTVDMGRKIYDDPNNPYGVDLIVFGNSFFIGTGYVDDNSDLWNYDLSSGVYGHPTIVSVSPDGTNWYAYDTVTTLFPQNAYRWDGTNHSWADDELNPTRPLNPAVYGMVFNWQPTALELQPFINSVGGTGYDLSESGFPWIQYVRIQPGAGTYTVIDSIAAVNPAAVGDALAISPDNLVSGITNLAFQNPANWNQTLISINFDFVSDFAKISTVSLSQFSAFAPVVGRVSSAYQIQSRPVTGAGPVTFQADVGLRAGGNYVGNGSDLRVYQWNGTNWTSQPFIFNPANNEVLVVGVTNFSAFVVSQIIPPQLNTQTLTNGFAFQFTPVPNCSHVLERSTDFVTWIPIATNMPASTQPITLQDTHAPADKAFYRLRLTLP
jgi:hypothetical protein